MSRMRASPSRHWGAVLAVFAYFLAVSADNTTCAGSQLDWYTQPVGETPCEFSVFLHSRPEGQFLLG
jgi:hypothetical protein